jgi:hypothetical protein
MKISTILDHIDSGHMALPEFQRGYVWNRDQVRGLFDSLYRRHPVGGLLVWATESKTAAHRGDGTLAPGVVKLLLDGQQRITTVYGVVRGHPPEFFDGNSQTFTGLRFHLESETFEFYQPIKMKDDQLWIDVSDLMQKGNDGLGQYVAMFSQSPTLAPRVGDFAGRLSKLLGIVTIELHSDEVTGADKSLDVVVDIFNRVNSGGTKLSKGDLALAKICAEWPEGRESMKKSLKRWADAGYHFNLDWLLRSVNTVLTGEAKFTFLHEKCSSRLTIGSPPVGCPGVSCPTTTWSPTPAARSLCSTWRGRLVCRNSLVNRSPFFLMKSPPRWPLRVRRASVASLLRQTSATTSRSRYSQWRPHDPTSGAYPGRC